MFRVTSPQRIAAAPSGAGFIVPHRFEDVIIEPPRLFHSALLSSRALFGNFFHAAVNGHQTVGLQKTSDSGRDSRRFLVVTHEADIISLGILLTPHLVFDGKQQRGLLGIAEFRVKHAVAVTRLATGPRGHGALHRLHHHVLVGVGGRQRNPNPELPRA